MFELSGIRPEFLPAMFRYRIFMRNSLHYCGSIFAINQAAAIAAFCWPDKDDEEFFVAQLCGDEKSCYTLSSHENGVPGNEALT